MFTQTFVQAQIKENIEAPCHWPLWEEFTSNRWLPRTKGQLRRKCFHLMTSSWFFFWIGQFVTFIKICQSRLYTRDHSGYGLSQWDASFHWLSPYPELSPYTQPKLGHLRDSRCLGKWRCRRFLLNHYQVRRTLLVVVDRAVPVLAGFMRREYASSSGINTTIVDSSFPILPNVKCRKWWKNYQRQLSCNELPECSIEFTYD